MKSHKTMIQRYLMEQLNLNEYRAKEEYKNLHRHADIEQEFANYILGKEEESYIKVEGYTAKDLHENYPLSILGAYNYLISLREEPEEALQLLKEGLPRW